jgi:hypothetical protein
MPRRRCDTDALTVTVVARVPLVVSSRPARRCHTHRSKCLSWCHERGAGCCQREQCCRCSACGDRGAVCAGVVFSTPLRLCEPHPPRSSPTLAAVSRAASRRPACYTPRAGEGALCKGRVRVAAGGGERDAARTRCRGVCVYVAAALFTCARLTLLGVLLQLERAASSTSSQSEVCERLRLAYTVTRGRVVTAVPTVMLSCLLSCRHRRACCRACCRAVGAAEAAGRRRAAAVGAQ